MSISQGSLIDAIDDALGEIENRDIEHEKTTLDVSEPDKGARQDTEGSIEDTEETLRNKRRRQVRYLKLSDFIQMLIMIRRHD